MADIEHDAALGRFPGEIVQILILDDRAAGLAIETMGDDVAFGQQRQDVIIQRRGLADMDHERELEDAAELFGQLDRHQVPAAGDHGTGAHLEPDDDVAIGLDRRDDAIEIDGAHIHQLTDAIAGHQPDRAEIEESVDVFLRRLDDEFAQADEIAFTGRACIDDGGDAARGAALFGLDRDIGAAIPDMGVKIGPARRHPGAPGVDDLNVVADREPGAGVEDGAVAVHQHVHQRRQTGHGKADRFGAADQQAR